MTWILNTIVSASLRRVSLGISANGIWLCEGKGLDALNFKFYTND